MTFRACSSPAPTPVKLQPAPAILGQESVHTTLSITHHTRKRPSIGPRTTHGPQGVLLDGEIWTAHEGVKPCGLVVRRGDRELRTRWSCLRSTRKLRRDTRTRRFYTGLGLRGVKPDVQFFILYCRHGEITWRPVPGRTPLPTLYWATDKVGGPESRLVTIGKPISS
jgi:hypothetical protein